ncbi:cytochrome c oxidase subunit 7A1, mitochondrial-like [Toxorhynchites rutilus septentrionalis]|uniref:cytochrome c oxidase subunit 7A1, mitochondrial-like n=1 Tax=Toxorhynchites rutilus septentrionalis TaxID=329112 RepID=UPI002478AC77|nr:cytochrome c oxidase subunit 7A1, mitochondrial-like [Toxorhynchites rutilus septentrionalis]
MGGHSESKVYISDKLPDSLRKNMQIFQAKNDLPVFLKGGPVDKALYFTTVALCGLGLLGIIRYVYSAGFASKKK